MLHNALTDNFIFFLIQSHHTPSLKALWYLEHGQSESRAWTYQSETKKEDSIHVFIRNKLDFILKSNNFYSENSLFTNSSSLQFTGIYNLYSLSHCHLQEVFPEPQL